MEESASANPYAEQFARLRAKRAEIAANATAEDKRESPSVSDMMARLKEIRAKRAAEPAADEDTPREKGLKQIKNMKKIALEFVKQGKSVKEVEKYWENTMLPKIESWGGAHGHSGEASEISDEYFDEIVAALRQRNKRKN